MTQPTHAGRHEIRELLGRGGAGSVYSGWDPLIGRPVAIKILPLGEMAPDDAMQWILREVQAAGALSHPHIVTVYDIGTTAEYAWIAMELVSGGSLAQALRDQTLQTGQSLRVLSQVASALDDTHRAGITHRDVKPANILLKEDGTAKIGDFGIARIQNAAKLTRTGAFVGTPQYMAPEQLQAKAVDGRADQFSLAIMAYEILAGQPPFTGESMIYQLLTADPPPFNPKLDPVFRIALAKKPEDRYQSCTEFVRAIESALAAAEAPPPPKWKFAATMAGIFAFVGIAGFGAWTLLNSAHNRQDREQAISQIATAKEMVPEPSPPKTEPVRKSEPIRAATTRPPEPDPAPPANPITTPSGQAIWSGTLPVNGVLTIEGTQCSTGMITRELPGSPVEITVTPRHVTILEAPSEANNWKKLRLTTDRETDTIIISYQSKQ